MSRSKRGRQFRPNLESMESRLAPAGNITAQVLGKNLVVLGDAASNQISIVGHGASTVTITPLDGTTTINGHLGPVTLGNIKAGVFIKMGEGDNNVEIAGVSSSRDFWVTAGSGNNTIGVSNVFSDKTLSIGTTGGGNDTIFVNSSFARGHLMVNAGGGRDTVSVNGSHFGGSSTVTDVGTGSALALVNSVFGANSSNSGFATAGLTAAPSAAADTATVAAGATATIDVLANDRALLGTLAPNSVAIAAVPAHGTATANSDGTVSYVNAGGTATSDRFTYTVKDAFGNVSAPVAVNITVTQASTGTGPTVAITTTAASPTPLAAIPFTATFSQPVTGLTLSDLGVTNGTASNLVATAGGTTYTFNVAPTADGVVSVSIPANAAKNSANLGNVAGSVSGNSVRTDEGMVNTKPDTSTGFTAFADGVKIRDIRVGTGATTVSANSAVTVFYTGFLASDGTIFDRSRTTGSPANFTLSTTQPTLIAGFAEGLVGMKPGGIRQIFIPSAQGYGANGSPPSIPANADLVFEVKLLATSPTR